MSLYEYYKDMARLELTEGDEEALEKYLRKIENDQRLSDRVYYNLRHMAIELTWD